MFPFFEQLANNERRMSENEWKITRLDPRIDSSMENYSRRLNAAPSDFYMYECAVFFFLHLYSEWAREEWSEHKFSVYCRNFKTRVTVEKCYLPQYTPAALVDIWHCCWAHCILHFRQYTCANALCHCCNVHCAVTYGDSRSIPTPALTQLIPNNYHK